jgi:hypothetical protein
VSRGVLPTTNTTGTACGPLFAAADVTVTVPLYLPNDRPFGLTETLRIPGVVPPLESRVSHAPLEPAETPALKSMGKGLPSTVLLDKNRPRGSGALHPISYVNARDGGVTDRLISGTLSVTGILTGLFDAVVDVIRTLPA